MISARIRDLLDHAPQPWHRWYANAFGYFWLPCPLCGKDTGGHQWRDIDGKPSTIPDPDHPPGSGCGMGICPACTRAGRGTHDLGPYPEETVS